MNLNLEKLPLPRRWNILQSRRTYVTWTLTPPLQATRIINSSSNSLSLKASLHHCFLSPSSSLLSLSLSFFLSLPFHPLLLNPYFYARFSFFFLKPDVSIERISRETIQLLHSPRNWIEDILTIRVIYEWLIDRDLRTRREERIWGLPAWNVLARL